jgi:protein involved in polysaccharide export with SLBB domain
MTSCPSPFALLAVATALAAAVATRAPAQQPPQVPPPGQAAQALQQAIQQQPGLADVLRSRIRESGLTPEQIRSRLRASGYPANLLDAYLADPRAGEIVPAPGAQQLAAIQALGLPAISVTVGELPVDTGLVRTVREAEAPAPDTGLQVFGVDVFRRTTTQFLPLLSGPVPPDYRLGPGDLLVLILTGDVELAYSLQVTREGFVVIPQVGQIFVSNLTLDQLRSVLYTRLGRVYSGVRRGAGATTQFDITVANVRAVQVYVVGEVAQPGAYQISALGTVLTGLYAAGGVTDRGNTRQIEVRRAGRSVASFDLYDYVLRGNTRNDIRLETGDVIFVPPRGIRATVRGAVTRAAIYELTVRETLTDLIAAAGGFRSDAALRRISIERIVPPDRRTPEGPQRVVIDVPLGSATVPPVPVEDGDVVMVDSLTRARRNFVEIRGNVYLPGRFGLEPGMRLSGLVGRAGGLQPATFAGRAHIERLNQADSTRYIIPVTLPADSAAPWADDPELEDYDIVTVYGRTEMRDSITVAIAGMVNRPGVFAWREGMTLRDLVLMARGPRIGAYLQEAEVARLPTDRSQGQLATTVRVPLDSTYLFDRDSAGRYIGPPGLPFPAAGAPEVELRPYDNVLILRQPEFELQRTVEIVGEVRFPGTYALRTKSDRISDLIERAGGLTPQAYPQGIRFVRLANNAGRINIDLDRALRERESRDNVILQPGDSIFVPEYQPSVRVTGAVNSPGSVLWRRGAGLGYYVSAAGGLARNADGGAVSVRQANGEVRTRGRFLFWRTDPEPGPGAEVFVPAKDPEDRVDYVALFGAVAQILASTVAIIVVVTR